MDPYAKPTERKVGANRPKISHLPEKIDHRTRSQRHADKQAVAAERRRIKKAARQELKRQLRDEIEDRESLRTSGNGDEIGNDLQKTS